jgi:hypothetical protein
MARRANPESIRPSQIAWERESLHNLVDTFRVLLMGSAAVLVLAKLMIG